jgi:hypothetical protein
VTVSGHPAYSPVAPDFHLDTGPQPGAAGWKFGTGSLLQKHSSPYKLLSKCLGYLGGRVWNNNVGHLPNELIEFIPLNSAEFLLLKNGKKVKEHFPSK